MNSFSLFAPSRWLRRAGLVGAVALTWVSSLGAAPANLAEAVQAPSPFWTEYFLITGADANAVVAGKPVLVYAVQGGHFEVARLLLQHGASIKRAKAVQPDLVSLVPDQSGDALAMELLLRSYALVEEVGRPLPNGFRANPERVMIYEPTVDYRHPGIAPYYFVNEIEKRGRAGVDDDNNGFVDDVYGWSAATNLPHEATHLQIAVWDTNREFTQRLVDLHNRRARGQISTNSAEWRKLSSSFLNPLAGIWGRTGGYSDADFLDHIINVSHGSHVAGIVIRSSRERARLHTMSWDTFGQELQRQLVLPEVQPGDTFEALLGRFRQANLSTLVARGHSASDFLRATRVSVANGSMGKNLGYFVQRTRNILEELSQQDANVRPNFDSYLRRLSYEMYAYDTIPFVIAIAENPQVLFVAAAGNAGTNNDQTLDSPSYLSRFFRNVITVAAADEQGRPADFTNRGLKSVNIAAPGVNIESYGVAGTLMLMDGTSMAAPDVSGVGAYLRTLVADATPEAIRRALQLGARRGDGWNRLVSSGGVMDVDAAAALLQGDQAALIAAVWALVASSPEERPVEWAWLRREIVAAAARDRSNLNLNFAEAVALDVSGTPDQALASIDRLLARSPRTSQYWRSKMIILANLGDRPAQLATAAEFDRLFTAGSTDGVAANATSVYRVAIEAATALANPGAVERWQQRYAAVAGQRYVVVNRAVQTLEESGALASTSVMAGDKYVNYYRFTAERDVEVTVTLESSDFDTYLIVRGPSGQEWNNDDFEGSTSRSRVVATVPEAGEYTVEVTSYAGGATGNYRLEVVGSTVRNLRVPDVASQGSINGELSASSRVVPDGKLVEDYTIMITRGDQVVIDMRSTAFDTLLVVAGPSGETWENDDFGGSTAHSRVSFAASETGNYSVFATSFTAGSTGAFSLSWQLTAGSGSGVRTVTEAELLPGSAADADLPTIKTKKKAK